MMVKQEVDLGAVIMTIEFSCAEDFSDNPDYYFNEMIEILKAMQFLDNRGITFHEFPHATFSE